MSDKSESLDSRSAPDKAAVVEGTQSNKLFVNSLDCNVLFGLIQARVRDLEDELTKAFEKYGKLERVMVKRAYRGDNCFAFVDFEAGVDGNEAVRK